MGIAAVVLTSPLLAIALARPLIDLASELRHLVRALVHRPGPDEDFAFRNHRIAVRTDERGLRWLRLADLRAIVPRMADDRVLERVFPDGCRRFERHGEIYLLDRCAVELLGRTSGDGDIAARLRTWVTREVLRPARQLRERQGLEEPTPAGDDEPAGGPVSRPS